MILVVDDDRMIRASLRMLLERAGYDVELAATPAEAMSVVRERTPRMVMLDMNFSRSTSGDEGLTLLKQIRIFCPSVPVMLMTAWGSIQLAVDGMKSGAADFITKPWDNGNLLERIDTLLRLSGRDRDNGGAADAADSFDRSLIVGESQPIRSVLDTVKRVAATSAPVLITGENGTGKELIARTLHCNSQRAGKPFVKVNLGGVSTSLFESEMFGHRRGAFTGAVVDRKGRFELAHTGTIFLDEIGDLDLSCQVKMLRVLQEQTFEPLGESRPVKVDVRVISATNAPLERMVADRTFREDLFYRLNLITVNVPPLRERVTDIPLLVRHFADKLAETSGTDAVEFTADAMERLCRLPYPGNIRELKNLVERSILISGKRRMDAADLCLTDMPAMDVAVTLSDNERQMIQKALHDARGNLSQAAARLGISRQALYRKMEKLSIPRQ